MDEGFEPDLETLVRRKAEGDQTNDSLNFLNSIAAPPPRQDPAIEAIKALNVETVKALKAQHSETIKALSPKALEVLGKPRRFVQDDDGEIIGHEPVDSLLPKPIAAKADRNAMEQAPPDISGVGAAQADPPHLSDSAAGLEALAKEAPAEGLVGMAGKVAADIGEGIIEAPLQAVGGVADGLNAFGPLATLFQDLSFMPMLQIYDREGQLAPALLTPDAAWDRAMDRFDNPAFEFPTTDRGDTVTGGFVRSAAQFIAGFDNPAAFTALESFAAPFASEYAGQCEGTCLGSAAPDGQVVVISPEQPLKAGDLAAFGTAEGMQYIKVLMGRRKTPQGPVWMFGQANPPLVAFQREADLLFIHRVRAFADADGKESEPDLTPVATELEMIAHLKIEGTWPPLNSGFRPQVCEAA